MSENEIKNYYLIFRKVGINEGEILCIVGDEDIAIQFCRDFEDFYYLRREQIVTIMEEEND